MPVCHNHELLLQSNSCTSTQSEKLGHEVSHFLLTRLWFTRPTDRIVSLSPSK
uniref:Uncharacterized protein n=1 Tax=Anguilla anguilla TaxID=7936 RepID=A0A0E9VRN3_ANGAN